MAFTEVFGHGVKNRRRNKRYELKEGVSVALGPFPEGVDTVEVIDIGVGGVSFKYSGDSGTLNKIKQVCILRDNTLVLDRLHCRMVYDESLDNTAGRRPRRIGAQFKWLPADRKYDLSTFIKKSSKSWFARLFG